MARNFYIFGFVRSNGIPNETIGLSFELNLCIYIESEQFLLGPLY